MGTLSSQQSVSELLGGLIAFDADGRAIWPAKSLRDALREQLRAHLLSHLAQHEAADQRELAKLTHSTHHPLDNFGDLLTHPSPPVELLRRTKDFAKRCYADPRSSLPPELCLLLYYGCIIVALVRRNQRISQLPDDDLRHGINWVVRQPWVDDRTRGLFRDGLTHLRKGRHGWRGL